MELQKNTYKFAETPEELDDGDYVKLKKEDFENLLKLAHLNVTRQATLSKIVTRDACAAPMLDWSALTYTRHFTFEGFDVETVFPLSFLSSRLSQFTKATRIFTTRDYTHTNVAAE